MIQRDTLPGHADRWLRAFGAAPSGARTVVCFPHAGGSATFFQPLARALSPAVDVVAVQYPGRQQRRAEQLVDSIDLIADQLFEVLRSSPRHPHVLFGHSMGAVIAFEVARRLEGDRRTAPAALIVSGRRAPSVHRDEDVHRWDDAALVAHVRHLGGTNQGGAVEEQLLRLTLPVLRNDYRAIETYRYQPGPTLTCSISVYLGESDSRVSPGEAHAWRDLTTGAFRLQTFAGGHFFLSSDLVAVRNAVLRDVAGGRSNSKLKLGR
jgi:pyochelin biosynthetic protein PchC